MKKKVEEGEWEKHGLPLFRKWKLNKISLYIFLTQTNIAFTYNIYTQTGNNVLFSLKWNVLFDLTTKLRQSWILSKLFFFFVFTFFCLFFYFKYIKKELFFRVFRFNVSNKIKLVFHCLISLFLLFFLSNLKIKIEIYRCPIIKYLLQFLKSLFSFTIDVKTFRDNINKFTTKVISCRIIKI